MNKHRFFSSLALSFLLFSFRVVAQSVCVSQDSFHIVVLGSSTAKGTGADPISDSWVNRYERYLKSINPKSKITNLAEGSFVLNKIMPNSWTPPSPNEQTVDITRNITKAISLHPDAIFIAMVSNDAFAGRGVARQLSQFKIILDSARAKNIPVWVSTTQPRAFDVHHMFGYQIQEDMKDTLQAIHGVYCFDFWTGLMKPHNFLNQIYYRSDSLHLNNDGHALLYQRALALNIPTSLAIAQDKNILVSQNNCQSPANIEIKQSQPGIKYKLRKANGTDIGSPLTGNNNSLFFQVTGFGVYKIIAVNESKNCERELSTKVTVISPPSDRSAFPKGEVTAGDSAFIIIPDSEVNVAYQLMYSQGENAGVPVTGTGSNLSISPGVMTASTTLKIKATGPAQCSRMFTQDVTVRVIGAPQAIDAYPEQSSGCGPFSTNIKVNNTDPALTYRLRNEETKVNIGQPFEGNGRALLFPTGMINITTPIEVLAKNRSTGEEETSDTPIILRVNNIPGDKNIRVSNSTSCGSLSTFINVLKSDREVSYVLRKQEGQNVHPPIAGTGGNINLPSGLIEKTSTYKVIAINNSSKCERELNSLVNFIIYELPKDIEVGAAETTSCKEFSSKIVIPFSQAGVKYKLYKNDDNDLIDEAIGNGNTLFLPTDIVNGVSIFRIIASSGYCERALSRRLTCKVNQVKTEIFQKDDTLKASGGESFQWFRDGIPLKGEQASYLLPRENGNYSVAIFDKGCSGTSKEVSYRVTGEDYAGLDIAMKIFPNPTTGNFIFQMNTSFGKSHFIKIYNNLGQCIHIITLDSSQSEIRKDFDIGKQPQGLYQIVISNGNKTVKRTILKI